MLFGRGQASSWALAQCLHIPGHKLSVFCIGAFPSGCGEQSVGLAIGCDGGDHGPFCPVTQKDITHSWHWRFKSASIAFLICTV